MDAKAARIEQDNLWLRGRSLATDGNCGVCMRCNSSIECPQCERRSYTWAAPPEVEDDSNLPLCNNVQVRGCCCM